jgi:hypothetical protein
MPAPPPPPPLELPAVSKAAAARAAVARAPQAATTAPTSVIVTAERREEKLGTAHGAREWSVSNVEPFERASPYPQFVRQIEYDTYDNLVASGVIRHAWNEERRPRPFPSTSGEEGYVADPPEEP